MGKEGFHQVKKNYSIISKMAFYNFTQKSIQSLNEIDLENSNSIYYTYKYCDFYYKKIDSDDKLVIGFHGFIQKQVPVPVFRGYNYKFNTLSFFDMMCKKNREDGIVCCSWFLSTKANQYNLVYIEIMQFFIKPTLYNNVIFVGSSAGGHPSLRYGIYFKRKVILLNVQFYIYKHYLYNDLLQKTGLKTEEFLDFQIEDIIIKEGLPEKTLIFINKLDITEYEMQYKPFKNFLKEQGLTGKVLFAEFTGSNDDLNPHTTYFPNNVKLEAVINKLFKRKTHRTTPMFKNINKI